MQSTQHKLEEEVADFYDTDSSDLESTQEAIPDT
jgi:hypothetical protein